MQVFVVAVAFAAAAAVIVVVGGGRGEFFFPVLVFSEQMVYVMSRATPILFSKIHVFANRSTPPLNALFLFHLANVATAGAYCGRAPSRLRPKRLEVGAVLAGGRPATDGD